MAGRNWPISMTSCSVPPRISRMLLALATAALHDADVDDDALVGVEMAVVDQGLERRVRVAGRRRHALDDGAEHLLDADAGLAAGAQHLAGSMPRACSISAMTSSGRAMGRSILLSTGTMVRFALHRQVGVGDGLGLHALEGIDEQDDALAGGEAARDFVVEIDVAGRVDQVQFVVLAVDVRGRW